MIAIQETTENERDDILDVERRAFGSTAEAGLVAALLDDPTAAPRLSLTARDAGRPVGHVLFTAVGLVGAACPVEASILAPLAVVPEAQGRGIGGALVEDGLRRLAARGTGLVFVLGHPGYYPRFGFVPAGRLGFDAPYPIPAEHAEAWMVRVLADGVVGSVAGRVRCAAALDRPEYWRE